jgi:hypothetical protein
MVDYSGFTFGVRWWPFAVPIDLQFQLLSKLDNPFIAAASYFPVPSDEPVVPSAIDAKPTSQWYQGPLVFLPSSPAEKAGLLVFEGSTRANLHIISHVG